MGVIVQVGNGYVRIGHPYPHPLGYILPVRLLVTADG